MDNTIRDLERALRRAGNDVVILDRTLVLELKTWIEIFTGRIFFYEAYCHFCKQTILNSPEGPKHLKNCTGSKFLDAIAIKTE